MKWTYSSALPDERPRPDALPAPLVRRAVVVPQRPTHLQALPPTVESRRAWRSRFALLPRFHQCQTRALWKVCMCVV